GRGAGFLLRHQQGLLASGGGDPPARQKVASRWAANNPPLPPKSEANRGSSPVHSTGRESPENHTPPTAPPHLLPAPTTCSPCPPLLPCPVSPARKSRPAG